MTSPNCKGCGQYHGILNVRFLCLERHLQEARAQLAPFLRMIEVVRAQPDTWVEKLKRANQSR